MRGAKTALKSGSSPLALSSFPKLQTAFAIARKGSMRVNNRRCLPVSNPRSLHCFRSVGEVLTTVGMSYFFFSCFGFCFMFFMRGAKTALKSGSSPLALSSFPKLQTAFAIARKGSMRVNNRRCLPVSNPRSLRTARVAYGRSVKFCRLSGCRISEEQDFFCRSLTVPAESFSVRF